ncbi:respiratory nitrate reductase subunit gamma [Brevibacillus sp. B_LB10_24]|uniref:respiratory nitrate reductase subunit gamma n=1 Tax=Brevibacillus sp. B_LB10_24 TaxID=3380645 RepID=UPI0038B7C85E
METIHRETFWLISPGYVVLLYSFAAISLGVFGFGFYRRFRLWQSGQKEKVSWHDVKANLRYFLDMAARQKKIKRDKLFGLMHRFVSYGFVVLFIGTCLVFIDYDLGIPILRGYFYLVYEAVLDVFGLLFIAGLVIAMSVRAGKRRTRLRHTVMDQAFLWLLAVIGLGGYVLEGIRISLSQSSYAIWSPVGYALSRLFAGNPLFAAESYPIWWMSHAVFSLLLLAIIPYTKLFHFLTAPIHILFQPVKRTGKISLPYHLDEQSPDEWSNPAKARGVHKISDFTNWQLLGTDACTECGRCDSQCPAHLSGKPLSPRSIVTKIRDHMQPNCEIGSFIQPAELQSCTTCGACVEACPVSINHIDLILAMRRGLIQNMVMETEAESTLLKLEEQYNIWGKPWSERADWSKDLQIPRLDTEDEKQKQGA